MEIMSSLAELTNLSNAHYARCPLSPPVRLRHDREDDTDHGTLEMESLHRSIGSSGTLWVQISSNRSLTYFGLEYKY